MKSSMERDKMYTSSLWDLYNKVEDDQPIKIQFMKESKLLKTLRNMDA